MSTRTIGSKMMLSAGALMTVSVTMGVASYIGSSNIGDQLRIALGSGLQKDILAFRIETATEKLVGIGRGEIVRGFMHDSATVGRYHHDFVATMESLQNDLSTLSGLVSRPDAKQAVAEIKTAVGVLLESEREINEAVVAGDMPKALGINDTKLIPSYLTTEVPLETLLRIQAEVVEKNSAEASATISTTRAVCGVALVVSLALGLWILFMIRRMSRDLSEGVAELAGSIGQIASAASQVASSSQAMAQGASEQAATIEETSSASAEINSMAQRNTENSRSTAEIVTGAQVRTEQTNTSLTEMVEAMEGITSSSQKISKIIKVIDEIAFQTNILALNAAVEAARAGDAGMGFAVVADEVRNLAQRSAQAAKDTAGLIEESILRSNGGKTKVDQVAGGIHTVTEETAKIKVLVDEINLGSVEQSRGIDQISRSITEMEQVTQSNAASAQESAAAAAELSSQAQGMRAVVDRLSEMVGSAHRAVATTTPARRAAHSTPRALSVVSTRSKARASVTQAAPTRSASLATAGSSFPMDDDFKEF